MKKGALTSKMARVMEAMSLVGRRKLEDAALVLFAWDARESARQHTPKSGKFDCQSSKLKRRAPVRVKHEKNTILLMK